MAESIIVALITGVLALCGTVASVMVTARKTDANLQTSQAVMDTKIEELTREVREHNHFGQRIPVMEEQIKVINHRIDDLEQKNG